MAVLDIDALVMKSYTGTVMADQAAIIPQLWAAELEPNLRLKAVLQESLLENTDLLGTSGDRVFIPTLPDAGTVSALTEGTDIPIVALDESDSVELNPSEVGLAFGITSKALDRIKYDAIAVIVSQLAYAMSKYLETAIASLYDAEVPGGSDVLAQIYPNGHTSGNVAVTDKFSSELLLEAVTQAEEGNMVPWDDGFWRIYISPRQYKDLLLDEDTRQDLRYSLPQVMLKGEVGVLHNTRIIKTNYIQQATENGATVKKALFVTPRWAAVAWKRRPEIVIDPTIYDFGRRRQFAVKADLDIELLHNDRALVVCSAVA